MELAGIRAGGQSEMLCRDNAEFPSRSRAGRSAGARSSAGRPSCSSPARPWSPAAPSRRGCSTSHQYEETYYQAGGAWQFELAALQGSSFLKLPRVLAWVVGNTNYHHVHHLSARISPPHRRSHASSPTPSCTRYIIPSVFNRRVAESVAEAVANAAVTSGVARRERGVRAHEPTTPLEAIG
jgi:hypothetical protein